MKFLKEAFRNALVPIITGIEIADHHNTPIDIHSLVDKGFEVLVRQMTNYTHEIPNKELNG